MVVQADSAKTGAPEQHVVDRRGSRHVPASQIHRRHARIAVEQVREVLDVRRVPTGECVVVGKGSAALQHARQTGDVPFLQRSAPVSDVLHGA